MWHSKIERLFYVLWHICGNTVATKIKSPQPRVLQAI